MDRINTHNLLDKIGEGHLKISTQDLNVYTSIHINGKLCFKIKEEKIPKECIIEYNSLIQDRNRYSYVGRITYTITLKNGDIKSCLYTITNYLTNTVHNTTSKEKYTKIIESLLYKYN